ncbi:MAG: MBL fold metallo-hydrolase [Acidimicrobiales bacterium]
MTGRVAVCPEWREEAAEWLLVARGRSRSAPGWLRRLARVLLGEDDGRGTPTVYLTGTGTPLPAPGRAGPGTLVVLGEAKVQVDAGRGTAMRLAEVGVRCRDLTALLITHHHSDHLMDLADLVLTRWVQGATWPLPIIVPDGPARAFVESVVDSWKADIEVRRLHGKRPTGPLVVVKPFNAVDHPVPAWAPDGVEISAVGVRHPPVMPAVAYRLEAAGASVVVSGDTRACPEVERLAVGADILVHEAMLTEAVLAAGMPHVAAYHADVAEVGALAARAKVRTLVLTHLEPSPRARGEVAAFRREVRRGGFEGRLIIGRDGMAVAAAARAGGEPPGPKARSVRVPPPAKLGCPQDPRSHGEGHPRKSTLTKTGENRCNH